MKKIPAALAAAIVLLCGCGRSRPYTADFFAMDTFMSVKAYGENAEEAANAARERIKTLEKSVSVTLEGSDIQRINNSGGGQVQVCGDTLRIINAAAEISESTGGALDISVYPVLREWGFTAGEYKIPDDGTVSMLLRNVDFRQVVTGEDFVLVPEGFMLDLGSVAKGFASDCAAEIMESYGTTSAIISLGGNVKAVGTKPDGSLWRVGIADPSSPGRETGAVMLADKAAVTSGNYQRYFEGPDGKRYCHIIDPETGHPADNGLASVTVIGDSGLVCDALSTALFVMGAEKAEEYWREDGSFEMILISDAGDVRYTAGLEGSAVFAPGVRAEVIK